MRNLLLFPVALFAQTSAFALEIVCKGNPPNDENQRIVYIDCTDRKTVIDSIEKSAATLNHYRIGGTFWEMCADSYDDAREVPPHIDIRRIAPTLLAPCNMGLRYVK